MKRQLLLSGALYWILSSTILLAQDSMSTEETKFLELILAEHCHNQCDMAIAGMTQGPPLFKEKEFQDSIEPGLKEMMARMKQRVREQLAAKGYQVNNLIDDFFPRMTKSVKILLPSSSRLGYRIDHDGKYEKYFSPGGDGYETWRSGQWSSPRVWARVSVPVYDPKIGIILIYIGATSHFLAGEGNIIAYKLTNETVEEIGRIMIWSA